MKFLVVGCGSIGKRHIGNLKSLGYSDILAFDTNKKRIEQCEKDFGVKGLYDYKDAFSKGVKCVFICTPPNSHMEIGKVAAENNCHILMEKPLANSMDGVDELINLCKKKNLIMMIAYMWRFWEPLRRIKGWLDEKRIGKILSARVEYGNYLPYWHPYEDYRKFYMAKKSQGGGAILDESHAIDFMRWLLGDIKEVFCFNDKISSLEIETDDIAEFTVRFESGAIGSIHMDLYTLVLHRAFEINGEEGIIVWDGVRNETKIYSKKENKWEIYSDNTPINEMYIKELQHFIDCMQDGKKCLVDGNEGKKTLEVVLAGIRSSKEKKIIEL